MANWDTCSRCGENYRWQEYKKGHECADVIALRTRLSLAEKVVESARHLCNSTIRYNTAPEGLLLALDEAIRRIETVSAALTAYDAVTGEGGK